jgi:hypothetical protein
MNITREQTEADPLAPALRQDGHAQLRMSVLASEVGRANDRETGISDDKDGVACQVDTFDIMAYTIVRQRVREPETAIFRVEGKQMDEQLWTFVRV